MLLRLRGPDGMKRITIDQNDTFAELGRQVSPNAGARHRMQAMVM